MKEFIVIDNNTGLLKSSADCMGQAVKDAGELAYQNIGAHFTVYQALRVVSVQTNAVVEVYRAPVEKAEPRRLSEAENV
jgi:hypothetical protein